MCQLTSHCYTKKLFSFLHFSFHCYYLASLLAVYMRAHTHTHHTHNFSVHDIYMENT